jgi:hypothetical protein
VRAFLLLQPSPTVCCPVSAAQCLLPSICSQCLLPSACSHCLLPSICSQCLLPSVCCPVPAAQYLLPVSAAQCLLPSVCFVGEVCLSCHWCSSVRRRYGRYELRGIAIGHLNYSIIRNWLLPAPASTRFSRTSRVREVRFSSSVALGVVHVLEGHMCPRANPNPNPNPDAFLP